MHASYVVEANIVTNTHTLELHYPTAQLVAGFVWSG